MKGQSRVNCHRPTELTRHGPGGFGDVVMVSFGLGQVLDRGIRRLTGYEIFRKVGRRFPVDS